MSQKIIFYIATFFLVLNFMIVTAAGQLQLTIDHTKIASSLSDFPVLIHLGTSSGQNSVDTSTVFSALGSDSNRKKISISTDSGGTQQLYVEIEKWDTANKQAWLWVKIPSVSSTTNTTLYLNYNASMADNTNYVGDTQDTPAKKVWSNGYVAVYHFEEKGNGTLGEYKDSTGKGHNGQGGSGTAAHCPTRVSSVIGNGGYYNGYNNSIKVTDADDLSITTTNHFTVSVWWNCYSDNFSFSGDRPYNPDGYIHWLGKEKDDPHAVEWQFVLHQCPSIDDSPGIARWYNFGPSGGLGAGADSDDWWKPGEWHYETGECDCTDSTHGTPNAYMEDARHNVGVTTWQEYGINYKNTAAPMYIGNSMTEITDDYPNWWWGQIDELQISNVSRSAAWVKASYYADKDALLNYTNKDALLSTTRSPVAIFKANITNGAVPFTVGFTDLSQNEISRIWNFGDGKTSTDKEPVHIYSKEGKYTVSLTASNAAGSVTATKSNYIVVTSLKPPVASFVMSKSRGKVPLTVHFTDKSTGMISSEKWTFGDGAIVAVKNPSHKFTKVRKWKVTLTVTNKAGSSSKYQFVTVTK